MSGQYPEKASFLISAKNVYLSSKQYLLGLRGKYKIFCLWENLQQLLFITYYHKIKVKEYVVLICSNAIWLSDC